MRKIKDQAKKWPNKCLPGSILSKWTLFCWFGCFMLINQAQMLLKVQFVKNGSWSSNHPKFPQKCFIWLKIVIVFHSRRTKDFKKHFFHNYAWKIVIKIIIWKMRAAFARAWVKSKQIDNSEHCLKIYRVTSRAFSIYAWFCMIYKFKIVFQTQFDNKMIVRR